MQLLFTAAIFFSFFFLADVVLYMSALYSRDNFYYNSYPFSNDVHHILSLDF